MHGLYRYLRELSTGRIILWCYAIWYAVNVAAHFDPRPQIWLTSLGLSGIIGYALIISTRSSQGAKTKLDPWVTFRLFLMPFCVSSFSSLVKGAGYVLIFPPTLWENLVGLGSISAFLGSVWLIKKAKH
jgi:hypothetical protein